MTILAKHITTKPGPENRLLRSHTGGILPAVTCRRTFTAARTNAFTPEEADSPLATRIYDLRHACLSQWFNSGTPATQVAEWAGNSPDILLRIYAYHQTEVIRPAGGPTICPEYLLRRRGHTCPGCRRIHHWRHAARIHVDEVGTFPE